MIDLFEQPDFLDAAAREALIAELRDDAGAAATVYGRGNALAREVDAGARRTTRLAPSAATREDVMRRLHASMPALASHFGIPLSQCEEPQFLRYREGDYFVAHQDGNTALLRADAENVRLVSVVVFVSNADDFGGGTLLFHPSFRERLPVTPRAGTLVAFRAETTHEVTPVTHGERYTIVSFYR